MQHPTIVNNNADHYLLVWEDEISHVSKSKLLYVTGIIPADIDVFLSVVFFQELFQFRHHSQIAL